MTERLPRVTAVEIIRVLEKIGISLARQSGSHKIYKSKAGRRVTVPYHAGVVFHPKLLRNILSDAEISPEALKNLL